MDKEKILAFAESPKGRKLLRVLSVVALVLLVLSVVYAFLVPAP